MQTTLFRLSVLPLQATGARRLRVLQWAMAAPETLLTPSRHTSTPLRDDGEQPHLNLPARIFQRHMSPGLLHRRAEEQTSVAETLAV